MAVTFLHSADWQIGKPFRAFGDRLAGVLEEARLDAIGTLADVARQHGAVHVLVAGDVFDAEDVARRTVLQAVERMAAHGDMMWLLLPGNHDPARAGGLWERIVAWGLPGNILALTETAAREFAPGAWLLAAPLTAKASSMDPTAAFDRLATPEGALRIGLAHGSIKNFAGQSAGGGQATSQPARSASDLDTIDPRRAEHAGLAYLALGDWHGLTRIDARTWYAGTPEPDRFLDNDPGHALVVTLDGAAPAVVRPVATGRFTWRQDSIVVRSLADLEREGVRLAGLAPQPSRLLLRLVVSGVLSLDARAAAEGWRDRLADRLRHLDADLDALEVRLTPEDGMLFADDEGLAQVAERLSELAGGEDPSLHGPAGRALLQLADITRAIERGEAA